ncbi:12110_t:CDS:2, partial [Funneliformis mosseae]
AQNCCSTLFALSPDDEALTQLYAATRPEIVEKIYSAQDEKQAKNCENTDTCTSNSTQFFNNLCVIL